MNIPPNWKQHLSQIEKFGACGYPKMAARREDDKKKGWGLTRPASWERFFRKVASKMFAQIEKKHAKNLISLKAF